VVRPLVLAGELPYPASDWRLAMWPLCGWSVRYQSTNMANSAFYPRGR